MTVYKYRAVLWSEHVGTHKRGLSIIYLEMSLENNKKTDLKPYGSGDILASNTDSSVVAFSIYMP
jgi:hypothetical protein